VQDCLARRVWQEARTQDGDGLGGQQVPQARHVGVALPVGYRVQVPVPPGIGSAAWQVEGELDDAVCQPPLGLQTGVGEHPEH
jgi:hypothetical protein